MRIVDVATDPWREADPEAAVAAPASAQAHRLLSWPQWQAVRATWPGSVAVGLAIDNDVDPESLVDDLDRFAVVALRFPKWTDGRAYSQARLLRSRLRYVGEVRATGDVVADMLPLLQRTGFDAVVLRADQSREVAERALGFFPDGYYQGDVVESAPRFARPAGDPSPRSRESVA